MDVGMSIDMKETPFVEDGVRIKPVVGYEDYYSVTDDGKVWSHPRVFPRAGTSGQPIKGRWLKSGAKKATGHQTVALTVNGKSKSVAVHILVARAFLGQRPEGFHIDHIDRDPSNNRLSNLRYATQSENLHNTTANGFCWDRDRNKYRAYITVNRKLHYLGLHDTAEKAREAFVSEKRKHGLLFPQTQIQPP